MEKFIEKSVSSITDNDCPAWNYIKLMQIISLIWSFDGNHGALIGPVSCELKLEEQKKLLGWLQSNKLCSHWLLLHFQRNPALSLYCVLSKDRCV